MSRVFSCIISGLLFIMLLSCSDDDSGGGGGGGSRRGGDNTPKPPKDVTGPLLSVTSPSDRSTLSGLSSITLEGECEVGGTPVTISGDIDGDDISTTCSEDGTFSAEIDVTNREEARIVTLEQSDTEGNNSVTIVHFGKFVFVLDNIKQIALGDYHSCALTNDGEVKCWGRNNHGQLGNGTKTDSLFPVDVHTSSTDSAILDGIEQIALGEEHSCALTTAGKVKCWGNGLNARLGNRQSSDKTTPVDVLASSSGSDLLSGIAAISLGGGHTCALTTGGNVKCWGLGNNGQVGNGSMSTTNSWPKDVHKSNNDSDPLENITAISLGELHTCALTSGGNVKCWGFGNSGRLGNGAVTNISTPVDVRTSSTDGDALSGIVAISLGDYHSCALTDGGNVKCWGFGALGQLGNGETSASSSPVDVCAREKETGESTCPLFNGVKELATGGSHTCVLMNSGNVKCWGFGDNGRLGNGETSGSLYPVDVCAQAKSSSESNCPPLDDVATISAGASHSCALIDDRVKCWERENTENWDTEKPLIAPFPSMYWKNQPTGRHFTMPMALNLAPIFF